MNAAQGLGQPFVSPYLQSIGSDYTHGANFATLASTVLLPNTSLFVTGVSPFSLAIQLNQMKQFKVKVDELHSSGIQICTNSYFVFGILILCDKRCGKGEKNKNPNPVETLIRLCFLCSSHLFYLK